jgi:hypothetical protein
MIEQCSAFVQDILLFGTSGGQESKMRSELLWDIMQHLVVIPY